MVAGIRSSHVKTQKNWPTQTFTKIPHYTTICNGASNFPRTCPWVSAKVLTLVAFIEEGAAVTMKQNN